MKSQPKIKTKHYTELSNLLCIPGLGLTTSIVYICIALIIVGLILFLPWHMDQYVMFHRLACKNSIQAVNTYRESCPGPYTKIGALTFYRSYAYIGLISSFIQAPFQLIYDRLITVQVVGVLFLFLSLAATAKSFRLPFWSIPLMALYFPISYSLIQDGGPVRISFLAISVSPYLIKKAFDCSEKFQSFFCIILIYGFWFASVEDKPFFLYLLPGLFFLTLASIFVDSGRSDWTSTQIKAFIRFQFIIFTAFVFLCLGLLALANDSSGSSYLHFLMNNSPSISGVERIYRLSTGLQFIFDWSFNADRIIHSDHRNMYLVGASAVSVISLYFFSHYYLLKHSCRSDMIAGILLIFSATSFYLLAWHSGGLFHHHFFFAVLPLAISTCLFIKTLKAHHTTIWLSILLAASISSLATVEIAPKEWHSSSYIRPMVKRVIDDTSFDKIVNCYTWGCYFSNSFSEYESVPFVWADAPSQLYDLSEFSKSTGKSIVHICTDCDTQNVLSLYPGFVIKQIDSEDDWKAFKVTSDHTQSLY